MTKDEALKLALEAITKVPKLNGVLVKLSDVEAAIKEALAQPEQEPVAYVKTVIEALYENSDPVSVEAAELLERITTSPQRKEPEQEYHAVNAVHKGQQCYVKTQPKEPEQETVALKRGECWPEDVMQMWDYYRKEIANGNSGSEPRDWFESLAEMRLVDTTPPQPEHDYKDLYEKEKRKSAMWLSKYEEVAGPTPKAIPMAQPEQEPVEVFLTDEHQMGFKVGVQSFILDYWPDEQAELEFMKTQLLAAFARATPPQRKPLTDEEIRLQWSEFWEAECHPWAIEFARAIEAAHGIKEQL